MFHRIVRPGGEVRHTHDFAELICDEAGRPVRLLGVVHDVTDAHKRDAALRETQERLRHVADNVPGGISYLDRDGRFLFANHWYEENYRRGGDEIAGHSYADVCGRESWRSLRPWFARALEGHVVSFEQRQSRAGVESLVYQVRLVPDIAPAGDVRGVYGLVLDVTERARLEESLSHAQRLEAVGQLTGGIAHDFNNNLSVIIGNLDLALEEGELPDGTRESIDSAIAAAENSSALTQRLLAFSRRQELEPQSVDPGELVNGMVKVLGRTIGETVRINVTGAADLWTCVVDPAQLESAILNLAVNAQHAMQGSGTLTLKTANVDADEHMCANVPGLRPGEYVLVSVGDTGSGIAEADLPRVFEPFFTTRPEGEGTGLGLSMVYGFAKQSGGHAVIDSMPGHGTTVSLYLPRERGEGRAAEGNGEVNDIAFGGGETVLLVEDDNDLRVVLARQLESLGYTVRTAENGDAAQVVIEGDEPVDVVLSDIVMPGDVSGLRLRRIVAEARPSIPVILMSGYSRDIEGHNLGDSVILRKPCSRSEVAAALARALNASDDAVEAPPPTTHAAVGADP